MPTLQRAAKISGFTDEHGVEHDLCNLCRQGYIPDPPKLYPCRYKVNGKSCGKLTTNRFYCSQHWPQAEHGFDYVHDQPTRGKGS